MSVLKNKRELSKLEFYHTARKLRKELIELLRRDFGIHSRGNAKKIDASFIRTLLRDLIWNITAANTIYATTKEELRIRRNYQNAAIINCQQLLQELQFCEDALPIKASKLLPFVETIGFEITLLKGWRKSDNKIAEKLNAI